MRLETQGDEALTKAPTQRTDEINILFLSPTLFHCHCLPHSFQGK